MNPILLSLLLGLTHGIEPDHIATARLLKSRIKIFKFALTHSAGFVIIALPIAFLIGDNKILYIISNIIGIVFAILLLIETITGKEFDIGPNKAGLLQGAFVITPTKVLTIVLAASDFNIIFSIEIILAFVLASFTSIFSLAILNIIPKGIYKIINIIIALTTIIYLIFTIIS
ncbi:MAG: hypothetical protein QXY68_08465 [Saccharolobus sp.]